MSPTPSKSISNEALVSMLQADPSFTLGGGGSGPLQTGTKNVKPFSSPGQGVWPGLVSLLPRVSSSAPLAPGLAVVEQRC